MRITEQRLKQIIKESLQDEYKEKLLEIFNAGDHQQALELANQVGMSDFLVGADLSSVVMIRANLSGANLSGADLKNARVVRTNLLGVDLTGANLSKARLFYVNLSGANLSGANLSGANLFRIKYDNKTNWPEGFRPRVPSNNFLWEARITERRLKKIIKESLEDEYKEKLLQIFKSSAPGAHQQAIELANQVGMSDFLVGADLIGADSEVTSHSLDLRGVNLSGVNLRGVNLSGVNLSGVNLSGADLKDADLSQADMRGVNLSGTNMKMIDLRDSDLEGANFQNANLVHVWFNRSNLKDADFSGADIGNSVALQSANLKDIKYNQKTNWPNRRRDLGYYWRTGSWFGENPGAKNAKEVQQRLKNSPEINVKSLKKIIKESIEDEFNYELYEKRKEKLLQIFKSSAPGAHQQAIELANQVGMSDFLVGADLSRINLSGSDLSGAIMGAVWLYRSDLSNTNLIGADLRYARLIGTNLTGADLTDAKLKGIKYDHRTIWPKGFKP